MINILTLNEWRESDDYQMQQWFINKKISVEKWFQDPSFHGMEFDYFEFDNSNNLYELYAGELYFNEDAIQWTMAFMIDAEKVQEGKVEQVKLILKGSSMETHELLGTLERDVDEPEIVADLLLEMINEFKTEHID